MKFKKTGPACGAGPMSIPLFSSPVTTRESGVIREVGGLVVTQAVKKPPGRKTGLRSFHGAPVWLPDFRLPVDGWHVVEELLASRSLPCRRLKPEVKVRVS